MRFSARHTVNRRAIRYLRRGTGWTVAGVVAAFMLAFAALLGLDGRTAEAAPLTQPNDADLSIDIFALKDGEPVFFPEGGDEAIDADGVTALDQPPNTVWAGNEVVYQVEVFNSGPDTAPNTTATITLPVGVEYLADTDNCTPMGGNGAPTILTCDLGDVERFDSPDFQIKTRVSPTLVRSEPTGTTVITVEASVTSDAVDDDPDDNTDTADCFVQDLADVKITKIIEPHSGVQAGEQFTYTLLVDNLGPSSARNIVVTDTLVTSGFVDANGCSIAVRTDGGAIDEFICNFAASTGVFDLATFGSNWLNPRSTTDQGRIIITINATADEALDLTNVSTVTSDTPDPNTDNNMAMVPLEISATADLQITDPDTPDPVRAGEALQYTINITNTGPSRAVNVVVEDNLPAEVEIQSVTASDGGSCVAGTPGDPNDPTTCNFDTLPASASRTMTVETIVKPDAVTDVVTDQKVIHNDVSVYSDTFDPDNSDNLDNEPTTVLAEADLNLDKFVVGTPTAGEVIHYEFQIDNLGPSVSRDVTLRDFLPDGMIFQEAFIDAEGGAGGVPLPCDITAGSNALFCPLGDIPPTDGAPMFVFVDVLIDPSVPDGTVLTNNADVFLTDTPDPESANNDDDATVVVRDEVDLIVRKLGMPQTPVAGTQFKYTIEVTNDGPSDAIDVEVVDTLPAGFTFLESTDFCSVVPAGSQTIRCRPAGTAFTTPPFVLPAGETVSFDVFVDIAPDVFGPVDNLATASVGNTNFSITSLGDTVNVIQEADLRVTKIVSPHTPVRAGEQFTYTILVDNLGPSRANNVVITDTLVTSGFVDANGCSIAVRTDGGAIDEFNCNFALSTGVFDLGTFGANWLNPRSPTDMGRVIITINLTADQAIDLTNTTTVTSDAFDPDTTNNLARQAHSVSAVSDLSVTKTSVGEVQLPDCDNPKVFDPANPGAFPAPGYGTSATEVTAGRRIRYTLEVTNDGPSRAENVVLSDRLPGGVTIVPGSLVTSKGSCQTGTPGEPLDRLTCGFGTLVAGDTETVTFDVVTDADLPPALVLENDAFVYSDIFDPTNENNYAFTQTTVNTWADMEITKLSVGQNKTGYDSDLRRFIFEDLPGEVTAGHELRYEITVQNTGPSLSQNVQVFDLLPGQTDTGLDHDPVTFLRADGAVCRPLDEQQEIGFFGAPGGKFGQVLWCDLGPMAPGERKTFDIYVHVDDSVPDGTTLTNGAFVWWGESSPPADPGNFLPFPFPQIPPTLPVTNDPCLDDNFAITDTDVNAVADVYIEKVDIPAEPRLDQAHEPDLAVAGEEHRYLITFGNNGWSVARDIAIQDFLDFKQFGILGENFLRCEPFDIDDFVSCSESGGVVDVDLLLKGNEQIVPGDLNPGDEYQFYLITEVDPGYVLDADDFIATNDSRITTSTTDFKTANNVSAHDTEIIAEADLTVEKVDDAAGFLECDPVEPGGMITYTITVNNEGPSDAAEVWLVDQLPTQGVVLDPDQVNVTVSRGDVDSLLVRDDGFIELRIGNDPNNEGEDELGRINAGSEPVVVTIQVMVAESAECGADVVNRVRVETRANPVMWPDAPELLPGIGGGPRTPTADPDPSNNTDTEATTVECPAIEIKKTVSFDGRCPGVDLSEVRNQTGQAVTYCFEITNTGTTFLDTILITDTLDTRTTMPTVIFTDTITAGADQKLPLAPGEVVTRQVTTDQLLAGWDCGRVTDTVTVTAVPVNSGRTVLPCLNNVMDTDEAVIDVPCDGVDWRLQLPILNAGECESWVQVQNVGDRDTKAMLVVWGEPGACPPQAAGPLKVECSGLLAPGTAWSFAANQIPVGAHSGMVYSLPTDKVVDFLGQELTFADLACMRLFDLIVGSHEWWWRFDTAYRGQQAFFGPFGPSGEQLVLPFDKFHGEPLAATVNRTCPDPSDENLTVNAAYRGISSDEEGARDPVASGYTFYAPLVFASRGELNSILNIHNSGDECTSLEIWFSAQDDCLRSILGDVLSLAPGETIRFDPNTVVGPDWLGSAWIRASQPLGVVVDTLGASHFTAYNGMPGDVFDLGFSLGNQINYAPLVYSEYQGWDSVIQVQNMSAVTAAKVKVYFLDRSGDIITTLVDWVCPRGSQTFFLPVLANIPGNWVGSARVESQEWWSPGQPLVDPPRVQSVVLLEKWSDPARTSRREAVAYNAQEECLLFDWQLGSGKGGTASGSAVFAVPLVAKGNRGINTELAITNLVPKPGITDFALFIYDQNGMLDYICEKLGEKEVEYIDMNTWGVIQQSFLGSAVISATFWEHDVFDERGGFTRNLVGLGAVAVERINGTLGGEDVPGDESKAYEGFPIFDHFQAPLVPTCPGLPPRIP